MKTITKNISVWLVAAYVVLLFGNFTDMWHLDWYAILFIPFGILVVISLAAFTVLVLIGKREMKRNPSKYPKPTYNRKTNNKPHKGD